MAEAALFVDGATDVAVLDIGVAFIYTIPSFSGIQGTLRQATIHVELPDGSTVLYDGFLQSDPSLLDKPSSSPFYITITKHCFVPVSQLNLSG